MLSQKERHIEPLSRSIPVSNAPNAPSPATHTGSAAHTVQHSALSTDRIERSAPKVEAVQRGFGAGLTLGASAEAGAIAGVGGTASVGAGLFYHGGQGVKAGAFASGGAFAGVGHIGVKMPHSDSLAGALGLFAGGGIGGFVTNAGSAQQLGGIAETCSANVGVGPFKVSGAISASGGTYVASVSVGPGLGIDASCYPTSTLASSP